MTTIRCDCGWSFEHEDEVQCWYEWISHDQEMWKTGDKRKHAGSVEDSQL